MRQSQGRLIDGGTRLGEEIDREQRRKSDEETDQHRSDNRQEAIRPRAAAAATAVYAPATADGGEEIEHSGDDQQVAAGDQTRAEGEHSEQERYTSRGRTGKSMAYRADRKSGQRDDDQEPGSSPKQGERDQKRRKRKEDRL